MSSKNMLNCKKDEILFTIGRNMYDNFPETHAVESFEALIDVFDSVRAPRKGTFYFTPAFGNDGRRTNLNCMPQRFVGFDLDGGVSGSLEDDQFAEICFQMSAWNGFRYETSSSRQGNRRARFILELDRDVCREDGLKIRQFIRSLMPNYGNWDKSCDNPAQPLYMPGTDALVVRFVGQLIPADEVLSIIPPPRSALNSRPKIASQRGSLLSALESQGYWEADLSGHMHRIHCPWADEHSDGRREAFYFEPSEINGFAGGFHCFHGHCQHRNIGHLINLIDGVGSKNAA